MGYFKIGDLFSLIGGGTPSTKNSQFWGSGIPWISSSDIDLDGNVSYSKYVTEQGVKSSTTYRVPAETIVVVTRVGLGKVCITPVEMCFSQDMQALIPNEQNFTYSRKYLFYQIKYLMSREKYNGQGTTISGITKKHLADLVISLPSLSEQRRIVSLIEELFSELDKSVSTLNILNKELIRYKRAVVKFELQREYTGTQWKNCMIGDVCDCLDSKRKPVNKTERASAKGLYPYYGANGETGRIDDYIFDEELVLICEDETFVGRIAPFSYIIRGKSWVNNHAHILRGKDGIIRNKYLNYVLSYYPFLPLVTGTTGRKKLTQAVLLKAPITICDFVTQKRVISEIESRLSVCDSIEQTVNIALQQADAMRQSILKQAFEGRL